MVVEDIRLGGLAESAAGARSGRQGVRLVLVKDGEGWAGVDCGAVRSPAAQAVLEAAEGGERGADRGGRRPCASNFPDVCALIKSPAHESVRNKKSGTNTVCRPTTEPMEAGRQAAAASG